MHTLHPVRISAWSWIGSLGSEAWTADGEAEIEEPSLVPLSELLSRRGLGSHESKLGIPGVSGTVEAALKPLVGTLQSRDSRCARLLAEAFFPLRQALEKATRSYGSDNVAIILASSTGGIDATEAALKGEQLDEYDFLSGHPHDALLEVLAGLCAASGPKYVISTACSSSAKAIAAAQRLLQSGRAQAVLTGGVDSLCETTVRGFAGLGVLSNEACRPFDAERSGISIGEGAALLLLERSGTSPYLLLGSGESSDAHHLTAPHPEGRGASDAFKNCLENCNISPDQVDFINAHGTGTLQNDLVEAKAIEHTFGSSVPFSSTKHATGHLLGTASAQEAIFCLKAFQENRVAPNLRPRRLDDSLPVQPSLGEPLKAKVGPRVAMSSSFAFGGNNACLALSAGLREISLHDTRRQSYRIVSYSVWSPEYPGLGAWRSRQPSATQGRQAGQPPALLLPPRTRGRSSTLVRLFAEVVGNLLSDDLPSKRDIPLIFASEYGEMCTTWKLLSSLGSELTLSPLRFQASVHSTAGGIISIATGNTAPSTSLAAGAHTFAAAITEAQSWLDCHGGEIIVAVADESLPLPLHDRRPFSPLAAAFRLSTEDLFSNSNARMGRLRTSDPEHALQMSSPPDQRFLDLGASAPCWALALLTALSEKQNGLVSVGPGEQVDLQHS